MSLPRPAKALQDGQSDGRSHEVFLVITLHSDDAKHGDNQSLWGNILRFANSIDVKYNEMHEYDHVWAPFVEQLLTAFDFCG